MQTDLEKMFPLLCSKHKEFVEDLRQGKMPPILFPWAKDHRDVSYACRLARQEYAAAIEAGALEDNHDWYVGAMISYMANAEAELRMLETDREK